MHDQICFKLKNESIVNRAYYIDFVGDRVIVTDIENYITKKFNNDTTDLVLAALYNSLGNNIPVYREGCRDIFTSARKRGRE